MTLTDLEREYLASQPLGRLATCRPDGSLQNSPVGFSYDHARETIDITGWSMGASRKFANVAHNGHVALVVDDLTSRDPWTVRGVEIRGSALALSGQATTGAHDSGHVIRILPRRVISWGLGADPAMRGRDLSAGPASPSGPVPTSSTEGAQ